MEINSFSTWGAAGVGLRRGKMFEGLHFDIGVDGIHIIRFNGERLIVYDV